MEPLSLIRAARALGLSIGVDGDRLTVRGPAPLALVALALLDRKPEVMAALRDAEVMGVATEWPEAARKHFLDQRVVTKDGVPFEPGSPRWDAAVREANRIAAGVPIPPGGVGEPKLIDFALAAFAPLGGLKLDRVVRRGQFDPSLRVPKQSSPPPSNPS